MDATPATPDAHHAQILDSARGIEALAGRAVCVDAVIAGDVPLMQAAAAAGDQREALKLLAADDVAARVARTEGATPCIGCGQPIAGQPYSVLVVSAGVQGSPWLAGPVCPPCGTTPAAIRRVAEPTLRLVWPGFHLLPPMVNAVGHA